ncbi:MAG: hypothetical protein A2008_09365 [Candidatus Wallbacteria bacterium GWC2_49_35]|uniref:Uncharacterized protein n=1 Tax=Candidatus Wallbacteria bacterium GWC2_49_35 TaxID=1817813 RepID=A0A1F7WTD4_9BACT|nr:MAG: hypothetical protein A2008_09365 [Candidatus Wallbacteria bacterium GWC2_49_35]
MIVWLFFSCWPPDKYIIYSLNTTNFQVMDEIGNKKKFKKLNNKITKIIEITIKQLKIKLE